LAFTDTLATLLPEYPDRQAAGKITIHHLLTHRSGVAGFAGTRFGSTAARRSHAELARIVAAEPVAFEPGSRQEYSNGGYVLLGRVVEVVSGQSYDDYVAEHVYRPAGMTNTGFFTPGDPAHQLAIGYFAADQDGRPIMGLGRRGGPAAATPASLRENSDLLDVGNAAGGGYSTVGDLFAFAEALRDGKLLDARMTSFLLSGTFSTDVNAPFGYGLREQIVGARRFVGNGGGAPGVNAEFRIEVPGDAVVVVLANTSPPSATELLMDVLDELTARVP
jgi:CubicO group peptidase (beta-lactamase class C family)